MANKNFKDSPALNFLSVTKKYDVQEVQEEQDAQIVQNVQANQENDNIQKVQELPKTQQKQEVQDTQEVQKANTQGKKGQKLPRINMAFQPENLEYLQRISGLHGKSITAYVNDLVEQDKKENAEIIEKAKRLFEMRS